jgi:hypothetical protein
MRDNLAIINGFIDRNFIGLFVSDSKLAEIQKRLTGKSTSPKVLDFSRTKLKRVFNKKSFNQGGRFYCGWWIGIPREEKRHIRINDMPTNQFV